MSGTNDPKNILRCNVAMHAFMHKLLYEQHGHWQDLTAWLGLSGRIGKDEILKVVFSEGGKKSGKENVKFRKGFHKPECMIKKSEYAKLGNEKRWKNHSKQTEEEKKEYMRQWHQANKERRKKRRRFILSGKGLVL